MSESPATPRGPGEGGDYAKVRERLVSMGYLARPLERYVLGGVARPGSFLWRHAAVSLRVAVAAGPPLGLLFALAVVLANRPRFSHARDFLVLAGGFTLVFATAVFVLELSAGVLLAAFVRWRGRGVAAFPAMAARAGFAVSLVVTAYLAYWWRRRAGRDAGMLIDLAGLAVLVLVNAALLRVSSLASLAALVRVSDLPVAAGLASGERESRPGAVGGPAARAQRARLLAPAALAAILLIAGFFIAPRSRVADAPSPYTRVPVKGRMIVVAWDGIDPRELERLPAREGDVVTEEQARLTSAGAMTPGRMATWAWIDLRRPSASFLDSPANLWTAVATGRSEHGVGPLEEERPAGLSAPVQGTVPLAELLRVLLPGRRMAVSARARTAKTLWEILGNQEGIACVGWWATWPATARQGGPAFDIVSDRALFALQRPSAGRFLIAPSSLERRLNAEFEADIQAVREEIAAPPPVGLGDWLAPGRSGPNPDAQRRLEQSALIDGYALRLSRKLLADHAVEDLFLYLPGLDIVQSGSEGESPPFREFVSRYRYWMRDRLEELDARLQPGDRLIVLALPGRAAPVLGERSARWGFVVSREPRGAPQAPELAASEGMDILDIAPTLLNLRGFPVSREMDGRSRASYADESQRPAPIETYGSNTLPSIPFSSSTEESELETLERLRALGYLN